MEEARFPLDRPKVDAILAENRFDASSASIREVVAVVGRIEKETSARFLRLEFGIPGFEPNPLGPETEIGMLRRPKIVSVYAPIMGIPTLKQEASLFLKSFLDVEIPQECVVPTVGSMQGAFAIQSVVGRFQAGRYTMIFVTPSFSVHLMQARALGLRAECVDLYDRAGWLARVEELCARGDIGGILYSSPNNPSWVILTEEELKRLGEICTKYDIVAIEDTAYFGMDFRRDYSVPNESPYPPTVARYTDHYAILLSSSKIFNYAGQRIGLAYLSPKLAERESEELKKRFGQARFGDAFILGAVYSTTAGVAQTPQYALATLLQKARKGEFKFLKPLREYGERAHALREVLISHGFALVYADDLGEPLSDGFFFTFSCPGMSGAELCRELLYYGISTTTLAITGSPRTEGIRACVSQITSADYKLFETRIRAFRRDHPR